MNEFKTYECLKLAGLEPRGAYLKAQSEGMNRITATRMLREVYGLDLMAAKEEMVKVDSLGLTLSEYQGSLLPELKAALEN